MNIVIRQPGELTPDELNIVKHARKREFGVYIEDEDLNNSVMIFLEEEGKVLAQGEVIDISPVKFNNDEFSILGIGGIIAEEKGKGYGREIMTAIKSYLAEKDKTGIGFCIESNKPFYEKCGFMTDRASIRRFVHLDESGERHTNDLDDYVVYLAGSDGLMSKVMQGEGDVLCPRFPDW